MEWYYGIAAFHMHDTMPAWLVVVTIRFPVNIILVVLVTTCGVRNMSDQIAMEVERMAVPLEGSACSRLE